MEICRELLKNMEKKKDVRYIEKYDVFLFPKDGPGVPLSPVDMIISSIEMRGFYVTKILFGRKNDKNHPLLKIKNNQDHECFVKDYHKLYGSALKSRLNEKLYGNG